MFQCLIEGDIIYIYFSCLKRLVSSLQMKNIEKPVFVNDVDF